jgi:hypothetical protein
MKYTKYFAGCALAGGLLAAATPIASPRIGAIRTKSRINTEINTIAKTIATL